MPRAKKVRPAIVVPPVISPAERMAATLRRSAHHAVAEGREWVRVETEYPNALEGDVRGAAYTLGRYTALVYLADGGFLVQLLGEQPRVAGEVAAS